MQWQREYFYPLKLFKMFFSLEIFRNIYGQSPQFAKKKKKGNENMLINKLI